MRYPIIVALDGKSVAESLALVESIGHLVWGFKFNDLFLDLNVDAVIAKAAGLGANVFIDLKLHDIPNTVANQLRRLRLRTEPLLGTEGALVTVHASGGRVMLETAVKEGKGWANILGVTVLTSLDDDEILDVYGDGKEACVDGFALKAAEAGAWGIVCSPLELTSVSARVPDHVARVVPGIRPEWHTTPDDQSRTATPFGAIQAGADVLVIGRPITGASDPVEAVEKTGREIIAAGWRPKGSVTRSFVETALEQEWLRFGEFTLKSGRKSPYFFNTGGADTGASLQLLAEAYGDVIADKLRSESANVANSMMLAGPAYKGIPLVAAVSLHLHRKHGMDIPWCFDRKESKDHGDKGAFVGRDPKGMGVIIVDDVITTGATKVEFVNKLRDAGATPLACVVAFDRDEVADGMDVTAAQAFTRETGVEVISIASFKDLENVAVRAAEFQDTVYAASDNIWKAYREKYGPKE